MSKITQIKVQRRTIKTQKGRNKMQNKNKESRFGFPINLQLFAESESSNGGEDVTNNNSETNDEHEENTPTVEEVLAELAKERAEKEKLKNSLNTTSSELAATKKQLKTKMTAEEQFEEEKRIADEAKDARIQELETKFRKIEYSKRYMGIGMDEKTAETISDLTGELQDPDKFFSSLDKFIKAKEKTSGEDALQKFLKSRPDIKAGSGNYEDSFALEKAKSLAKKNNENNENILKYYRR